VGVNRDMGMNMNMDMDMDMRDEVLTILGPKKSKRHQLENGCLGKEQVEISIVMTEPSNYTCTHLMSGSRVTASNTL